MNWDDFRIALAIKRGRNLSAAARELSVNQTTITRRLERLEADLDVKIFDRVGGNMQPTPEGERIMERLHLIEEEAIAVQYETSHHGDVLSGPVRVTSVQSFITSFLAPRLMEFTHQNPKIRVEMVGSTSNLNLSRREADLAVRFARPKSGNILAQKIGCIGMAVYASRTAFPQATQADLKSLPWVGYDDTLTHVPEAIWLEHAAQESNRIATSTEVLSLLEIVKSGIAVSMLPCFIGDPEPDIVRLTGTTPVVSREIWLLTLPDTKGVRRVQIFSQWLQACISNANTELAGVSPNL